jgi:hypothetical protein
VRTWHSTSWFGRQSSGLISPATSFIRSDEPMPIHTQFSLTLWTAGDMEPEGWLAGLKRIGRCHPREVVDPVPPVSTESIQATAVPLPRPVGPSHQLSGSLHRTPAVALIIFHGSQVNHHPGPVLRSLFCRVVDKPIHPTTPLDQRTTPFDTSD